MLIPDYHLQYTFGYQIRFRSISSGIKNFPKYRVVLQFVKHARAGLRAENHDPVPTLVGYPGIPVCAKIPTTRKMQFQSWYKKQGM